MAMALAMGLAELKAPLLHPATATLSPAAHSVASKLIAADRNRGLRSSAFAGKDLSMKIDIITRAPYLLLVLVCWFCSLRSG
jgi:hypothetical protein